MDHSLFMHVVQWHKHTLLFIPLFEVVSCAFPLLHYFSVLIIIRTTVVGGVPVADPECS